MSDIAAMYRRRADAFEALIEGTPPDRWSSPSPCDRWSARDVVAHVVDFSAKVLREKAGVSDAPECTDFDDPAVAFRGTREAVQRVLDDPGTPSKVAGYLEGALSFDLPQHGWDLAVATGQDATMDGGEVEFLWTSLTREPMVWEWQRSNGWYGKPVPVPEDAPLQDRVLGLLGRDPRWMPPGGDGS